MALTNPLGKFRKTRVPGGMLSRHARISHTFRPGAMLISRAGAEYAEVPSSSAPRAEAIVLGFYEGLSTFTSSSTSDGAGGAMDTSVTPNAPQMVQIRPGIIGDLQTGSGVNQILAKHVDLPCFLYDDDTVYLTDLNGTLPFAGFVDSVASDGTITIRCGENERSMFELFSSGQSWPSATSDITARAVATSLPAGAFSGGVYTATADGAFSTAQDGVTPAVGDIIMLPVGTLTTLVVSAANSGPYEVTSLGSASSKLILTRPAKWAHGAIITPQSTVKVGGESALFIGSKWPAMPASAALVVGTGDPNLYPDRVIQTVTLVSSEKAVINVPIRSATKSNVKASLAAVGGTTTNTINYGIIVAPTPGGIGTATTTVNAIASGGTKNGTSDTSLLIVEITN